MRSAAEILIGGPPVRAERQHGPGGCGGCAEKAGALNLGEIVRRDFILARFCQTAGGVFLDPFEKVRLDPGGRVSSLAEPAIWSRHGAGFAIFPRAGIPTMMFNRTVAGLPVGYFTQDSRIITMSVAP